MLPRPRSLKKIFASDDKIKDLLRRERAQRELADQVRCLLPQPMRTHLIGARVERSCLILLADSSAWASRMRFGSRQLRGAFPSLRDVRVKAAPRSDAPAPPPSRARRAANRLSPRAAEQMRIIATALPDERLSRALLRLAGHTAQDDDQEA